VLEHSARMLANADDLPEHLRANEQEDMADRATQEEDIYARVAYTVLRERKLLKKMRNPPFNEEGNDGYCERQGAYCIPRLRARPTASLD